MTAFAVAVMLVAFVVISYAHLGFPALLSWLARRARWKRPRPLPIVRRDAKLPSVSILVAAWNEEEVMGAKIENALTQDYPADRLEIIVASDGSTDRTNEIVGAKVGPRVRLVGLAQRGGKARAIRQAAAIAKGEVLVLTDANTFFAQDAVSRLVQRLDDATVSCAFGNVQIRPDGCPYAASEGLFYKIERRIQRDESELDSCVGVDGALYAIRRDAFQAPPDGAILDDLEIAIEATRKGGRVVYEPRAIAWEDATPTLRQEFRRKTRIVAGAIQALRAGRMVPDKDRRWLWFCFASHKLLRWAQPLFLIAALLASAVAAIDSDFALACLVLQLTFYAAALVGLVLHDKVDLGVFSVPLYFTSMHAAALTGLVRGLRGGQRAAWQRADRKPVTAATAS